MLSLQEKVVAARSQVARERLTVSRILERLTMASTRPRYAFMVLNLIAEAADASGKAGPFVIHDGRPAPVRDWIADMLAPTANRDFRRLRLRERIEREFAGSLKADPLEAKAQVDAALAERVRMIGRANVSRAVSDLVKSGLVRRHYAGWIKNHVNRGGQRHAVYTVDAEAFAALRRSTQLL